MERGFVPKMFIGVGAKGCFFTMRETYEHIAFIPTGNGNSVVNGVYQGIEKTVIKSFHHVNLAIDADEAFAKAKLYAAEYGIELITTRETLEDEMNAIIRATADELNEQAAKAEAMRVENEALILEREKQALEVINAGFFPFGKYCGLSFYEAGHGYAVWLVGKKAEFEAGSLLLAIAEKIETKFSDLLEPQYDTAATVGEIGQRLTIDVEVMRVFSFVGAWGQVNIVTMRTAEKVCVVAKGAFSADAGKMLKIKATIKGFDDYKGQVQTKVNRVVVC